MQIKDFTTTLKILRHFYHFFLCLCCLFAFFLLFPFWIWIFIEICTWFEKLFLQPICKYSECWEKCEFFTVYPFFYAFCTFICTIFGISQAFTFRSPLVHLKNGSIFIVLMSLVPINVPEFNVYAKIIIFYLLESRQTKSK